MIVSALKTAAMLTACAALLAGCDFMKEVGKRTLALTGYDKPLTLVIPPGYRVSIAGDSTPIFGFDKCPPPDEKQSELFGAGPVAHEPICVVIKPDAASVEVLVGLPDGPVRERWGVEKDGDKTRLRRPDGTLVIAAE